MTFIHTVYTVYSSGDIMKAKELIRQLEAAGFVQVKTQGGRKRKGNHIKYKHPDGRWTVVSHGDKDFGRTYVDTVAKQAGIEIAWK